MPLADDVPLALANRFKVKVDAPGEIDLGSWAKVDGLDVTFDVVEYRAGDAWNSRWYCPGATKYSSLDQISSSNGIEYQRKRAARSCAIIAAPALRCRSSGPSARGCARR